MRLQLYRRDYYQPPLICNIDIAVDDRGTQMLITIESKLGQRPWISLPLRTSLPNLTTIIENFGCVLTVETSRRSRSVERETRA